MKKIFLLSIALKNNEADVKKLAKQVYTVPKCSFVVFCVENGYKILAVFLKLELILKETRLYKSFNVRNKITEKER